MAANWAKTVSRERLTARVKLGKFPLGRLFPAATGESHSRISRNLATGGAISRATGARDSGKLAAMFTSLHAPRTLHPLSGGKSLVACFSHSGNTREIARQIQAVTGADAFEIAPAFPYPTDYNAVVDQAKKELNANFRPALKSTGPDLAAYVTIFVGSPNWWSTIAPPVMTYLDAHNFAGKTIVPFITHEGSRMGRSVQDVKRLCPGATVLPGQPFRGSDVKDARADVLRWLRDLRLAK